jgi:TonB family protein
MPLVILLIAVAELSVFGQSGQPLEWHTITSHNGEFSVALPVGYTVNRVGRWDRTQIVAGGGGASFVAHFTKTLDAERLIKGDSDPVDPIRGKEVIYIVGESRVRLYTFQGTRTFRVSITVGTKQGYYWVEAAAPSFQNATLVSALASIKLNQKPLVKNPRGEPPISIAVVEADDLDSSDVVVAALKRKQKAEIPVDVAPDGTPTPEESEIVYSRRVMVLNTPRALYTDKARSKGVEGTVRIRILFRGDGNIGRITIIKGLPHGLNDQVIAAAKLIKFLPAQIDGMPADAESTIEYSFDIY